MEHRPAIEDVSSSKELKRWYWLKSELSAYASSIRLSAAGSKQDITDRLGHYFDTGEKLIPVTLKPKSSFDWSKEVLSLDTIITDSYRNGPNVRRFFKQHYGASFTFNIAFMRWMRENTGLTLLDALHARKKIAEAEALVKPAIPDGNQYNAYTRAFFRDNPDATAEEARECWSWKKSRPGHNRYERSDLKAVREVGRKDG